MKKMRRLSKVAVAVLLMTLLASIPGLAGCGGGAVKTTNTIKYGWCWDFTGRAAYGVTHTFQAVKDYLEWTQETNPVEGVNIEMITWDTHSDASRITPGYFWLKGQGAQIMSASPPDMEVLRRQLEKDEMPFYIQPISQSIIDSPLIVGFYGTTDAQIEATLHWIMENWDVTAKGKCRIGVVTLAGVSFYMSQVAITEKIVLQDHANVFQYVGAQMAPTTTTAWAGEIAKLKDSDYIVVALSGPSLSSFLKEARQRGYGGKFVGPMESWLSFWPLVKASVSEDDLNGIICATYMQWWTEPCHVINEASAFYAQKYTPAEIAEMHLSTSGFNGWIVGMILVDALRRAAESAGPENVTGKILFEALKETRMIEDGWDQPWEITEGVNCLMRGVKLMQYNKDIQDWKSITSYVIPPSLGG